MSLAGIPWNPPPRMLRQFAALCLVFGALLAWRAAIVPPVIDWGLITIAVLAVAIGVMGLIWPRWIRVPFLAAALVTWPIGWVVSQVVLAALFYLVFTPVGFAFRVAGRDALVQRRPNRPSHWLPRPAAPAADRYFRQF